MKLKISILSIFCLLFAITISAKQFTVVLDPGHGGKDPGAVGKIGQEKNINLEVALTVGRMITEKYPDVKIVYTRQNDKYVTLQERPNIANNADGDLFISIHTNASESSKAYGAETFTLGLSKSQANFEVAKRENSVLLLEEGNKETYQGFDPTSPDSYIMFEFMQSKYIDQSVEIAYYIQKEFVEVKRLDRGVRQAIFWVLHQVKMPSILIELGFITNPSEEKFLLSEDGQKKLASCIFNAFEKYKHEYDKRTITTPQIEQQQTPKENNKKKENQQEKKTKKKESDNKERKNTQISNPTDLTYKIQIFSSRTPIASTHYDYNRAKKFNDVDHYFENNWYKYTCCKVKTYKEAEQKLTEVQKVFKDAMIVVFEGNKKISLDDAKKREGIITTEITPKENNTQSQVTTTEKPKITYSIQIFSSRTLIPNDNYDMRRAKKFGTVKHFVENGWYKYYCTETDSYTKARENLTEIREIFKDAVIVAFEDNKKISLENALNINQNGGTAADIEKEQKIVSTDNNEEKITFNVQIFSSHDPIPDDNYDLRRARKFGPIKYYIENGWYKYICCETESYEKAKENLNEIRKTFKDAVLVTFNGKKKISLQAALEKLKTKN